MVSLIRTFALDQTTYASPTDRYLGKSKAALTAYRMRVLFASLTFIMTESLALYGCNSARQVVDNTNYRGLLTLGVTVASMMILVTLVVTAFFLRRTPYPLHFAAMDCERIQAIQNVDEFHNRFTDLQTLFDNGIISTVYQARLYQLYNDYEVATTAEQKRAASRAFRALLPAIKLDLPFTYADV